MLQEYPALRSETADVVGAVLCDPELRIVQVDTRLARMLGFAPIELIGRPVQVLVAPDDHAAVTAALDSLARRRRVMSAGRLAVVRRDGSQVDALAVAALGSDDRSAVAHAQIIVIDLPAPRAADAAEASGAAGESVERLLRRTIDALPIPAALLAGEAPIVAVVNRLMVEHLHSTRRDLVGTDAGPLLAEVRAGDHHLVAAELLDPQRDSPMWLLTAPPVAHTGQGANPSGGLDRLTGLMSREQLLGQVRELVSGGQTFSVLLIDVDNFKVVNDTYGHAVGDEVLKGIAAHLRAATRPDDVVARYGGDEFVVICRTSHAEAVEQSARAVAERIVTATARPLRTSRGMVTTTVSIGISNGAVRASTAEERLQQADRAMYSAKDAGKNQYHVYDHRIHARVEADLLIEEVLHSALAHQRIVVRYDPIARLSDGALQAVAARTFIDDGSRLIPPETYAAAAERTGLAVPIGAVGIEQTCATIGAVNRGRTHPLVAAVTVSGRQLEDPNFAGIVTSALTTTGMDGAQLLLQIAESVWRGVDRQGVDQLAALSSRGVGIAVHRFGSAGGVLDLLHHPLVSHVTIDARASRRIPGRSRSMFVQMTVDIAERLGLSWTVLGVDGAEDLRLVPEQSYGWGQGRAFGADLSAGALGGLVR